MPNFRRWRAAQENVVNQIWNCRARHFGVSASPRITSPGQEGSQVTAALSADAAYRAHYSAARPATCCARGPRRFAGAPASGPHFAPARVAAGHQFGAASGPQRGERAVPHDPVRACTCLNTQPLGTTCVPPPPSLSQPANPARTSRARSPHPPTTPSPPRSRQVYCTLLPFDRGDFRWEFLAPWSNKSLTPVDKLIICTSFIGTAFGLQQLFEPGASVGVHASYIAQFFS